MVIDFDTAALGVMRMAHHAGLRDWVPATSGNFSVRMDNLHCAVTATGGDKGQVTMEGIILAPIDGPAPERQSAEAELHYVLYRLDASIGAVAHVHAMPAVLASLTAQGKDHVRLEGLELLKAFAGLKTHETALDVPVFENDQDMIRLGRIAKERLAGIRPCWGFLIAGHGLYAW
ncbi:MAG TPA: methylthioribulose 1-phosphate dehydratase, partial [Alphaproteobacteria bacterium]|nr:methylthioribulose 1-phosphate dehydratase [Alphaproteobacteria bacterium]